VKKNNKMPRKVVPLTDEIKNSSLLNVRTWDGSKTTCNEENLLEKHGHENDDKNQKVKDIVTRLNKTASSKFNIFVTKNDEEMQKAGKLEEEKSKVT
jgi:hypothetical protein